MEKIPTGPVVKGFSQKIKVALSQPIEKPAFKGVALEKGRARKARVICNHFNLSFRKSKIYQFNARFNPKLEENARDKIDEIFRANTRDIKKMLGNFVRAVNCVFSFSEPQEKTKLFTFSNHEDYKLELIKLDKAISFDQMESTGVDRFEIFRVVNFQIKNIMRANKYIEFGIDRKYFDVQATRELEVMNGDFLLNVMKGYKTTMDVYEGGIPKILIDCCSRVIRVYDLWQEYLFWKDSGMSDDQILNEYIIGRSFLAYYGNQRIYRIEHVDYDMTPLSKFPNKDFKNFKDYFKKTYNVDVQHDNQFLVVAIRRKKEMDKNGKKIVKEEKIYLLPELLKPTGLTDEMRKNGKAMRDLAKFTQIDPIDRDYRHSGVVKQMNNTKNDMNLTIDPNSNYIDDAIIYNPPKIYLEKTMQPRGAGVFRIKEKINAKNAKLKKWLLICDARDKKSAQAFALTMLKSSKSLGIVVDKPKIVGISEKNYMKLAAECTNAIEELNPSITLLFFQKRVADRIYDRVKFECNVRLAQKTQFFVNWRGNDRRSLNNMSIASNIVMQMTTKLGYPPWLVQKPYKLNDNGRQTMVIGADVFHTGHKDSVAAVVATMDSNFTKYYSTNSFQMRRGDDILHCIADKVIDCTKKYTEINKFPPDMIVFYRDGIGLGQYDRVREIEIASIMEKLEEFKTRDQKVPKIAYIVVTKRINDRFFEQGYNKRLNKKGPINPQGGMIVQSGAVNNVGFDYFMIAQNVNRGTATPVHFEVLFNNTGLTADSFYELTYYQTFNYYNWTGPVKVPSVVQYATKQAYLVGSTKKKRKERYEEEDNEKIRNSLYFL